MTIRRLLLCGLTLLTLLSAEVSAMGRGLTPVPGAPRAKETILPDLEGNPFRFADHRGKVLLVNFWATWCPPCRKEMPSMQRLQNQWADKPFMVIAVDVGEDAETVWAYAAAHDLEFTMLRDKSSKTSLQWGVRGLPTTFLVDAEGRIVFRALGGREWDDPALMTEMEKLLPTAP